MPACPSRVMSGWLCPGCGSLRAAHHLLHLRVGEALRHNALAVALGAPALLFVTWSLVRVAVWGRRAGGARLPGYVGWVVLVFVVVFGVLRNVPHEAFDVLRPPGSADFEKTKYRLTKTKIGVFSVCREREGA
ncbi:MAG: DUF2752 domain-containing protein [Phycisphaerales bacterium]